MATEPTLTVIGNLTSDPELKFTGSGAAVANFTIASTPRVFDRTTNEWRDGDALFLRCSVWREYAENVAETLKRGNRVLAQGRLRQRTYENRDGERRTVVEMDIDEIGPALRFATASVYRAQREGAAPRSADAQRIEAPAEPVEAAAAPRGDLVGAGVGAAAPPF